MNGFEFAEIAPVMRTRFIQGCLQIFTQRRRKRGFIAGLHGHRIDQRREQAFAFRMQQIAQRLYLGGKALNLAFGGF